MRGCEDCVPPCCALADDNREEQNAAEHLGLQERDPAGAAKGALALVVLSAARRLLI